MDQTARIRPRKQERGVAQGNCPPIIAATTPAAIGIRQSKDNLPPEIREARADLKGRIRLSQQCAGSFDEKSP